MSPSTTPSCTNPACPIKEPHNSGVYNFKVPAYLPAPIQDTITLILRHTDWDDRTWMDEIMLENSVKFLAEFAVAHQSYARNRKDFMLRVIEKRFQEHDNVWKFVNAREIPDVVEVVGKEQVKEAVVVEKALRPVTSCRGMGRAPRFPGMVFGGDKKLKRAGE